MKATPEQNVDFGWDHEQEQPLLRLHEMPDDGVTFTEMGAEHDDANTLFVLTVDGIRIDRRRPEPILIEFLRRVVEEGELTLSVDGGEKKRVSVSDDRRAHLTNLIEMLRDGLSDSPLASL